MRDFGAGFTYLLNGQRWMARHARDYRFGLLPGVFTLLLYLATLAALITWGYDLSTALTTFAGHWPSPWPGLIRGLLTVLIFVLFLSLAVACFTAVTLLLGQPVYETLSARVDRSVAPDGTAPESDLPLWRQLWISARDSLRILVRTALWGILLFALGFLPVVGQTVVPVAAILVTGFFLTEELTAIALQRRSIALRDRLTLLRSRKALVWGFGAPLAAAFLIPFVAVLLMPGAVAGATLLARDLLAEDDIREAADGRAAADPAGEPTA
ncbi:EI24 domain-containing protein [Nocardia sp. alder85J]|uniref:EI24 domain-containing protein n=1 Tax=Nocardia sp. alder85J TaxID=2862949 RepID=UPI001CD302C7|nr:EI24 domain-containing protein [Nocardia sp. alder85J]MCX4091028.1 EI24 domain-containing protein [Nocardia sp. alder85J]